MLDEGPPPRQKGPLAMLFCCCTDGLQEALVQEFKLTAEALQADPPLELQHGYASAAGTSEVPPSMGMFEIVNKSSSQGEIIGVLVATNAVELARGHDPRSLLADYLAQGCMPDKTVMHARFDASLDTLQVVLFHGPTLQDIDEVRAGNVRNHFLHAKGYEIACRGKNVLLKYKHGELEPQRGTSNAAFLGVSLGKKTSIGGGIDMKTNITDLMPIEI